MVKPFKFKLDKVLDFREQLEEQAKAALSRAKALRDAQAEVLADLETRMQAHLEAELESRKSTNDMWLWRQYKQALEQDISIVRVDLNSLELKLQRCLTEAVERSRDKKLLEKLKETQSKKHHEEENAREEKENDEMATLRYEPKDI
ncbi:MULTISPECIES: flagellar export protein FliJ [unclassified Pseudodesulfovibrio]|uniref:flagellar export protein FliJ n=1 Tax=unclassified Pseudodesulfovibrio TaxID=2661612 RepID=UPI000FEB674E|nr:MULTISPECIES: flagellar export protein FliJ [unclassified Pseudodesulfovibrio]MCJ2165879.1 flagellar export protein FliJ [Pseudodesulfovibrio sp. S3-i]RWU02692.1 flagellar export protein FliJ [Pseudodesulfovibrio sp. S3]